MDRTNRRIVIAIIILLSLALLFGVSACIAESSDRRNASLCIDQGGVYVKLANGQYDCVGDTPSMTRTR